MGYLPKHGVTSERGAGPPLEGTSLTLFFLSISRFECGVDGPVGAVREETLYEGESLFEIPDPFFVVGSESL